MQQRSVAPDGGRAVEREITLSPASDVRPTPGPAPSVARRPELTPGVHLAPWTGPGNEPVLLVVRRDRTLVGYQPWIVPQVALEATIEHAWAVLQRLDGAAAA